MLNQNDIDTDTLAQVGEDAVELATIVFLLSGTTLRNGLHELSDTVYQKLLRSFEQEDFTDIFALSAALIRSGGTIDGAMSAKLIHILTKHEVSVGGPYAHSKQDLDLLTNVLIAIFLQSHEVTLPKLKAYIENTLRERDSRQYPKYVLSVFFAAQLGWISDTVMQKSLQHVLDTTVITNEQSALLNYVIVYRGLQSDYTYTEPDDSKTYSPVLSAAKTANMQFKKHANEKKSSKSEALVAKKIYNAVESESRHFNDPLRSYLKISGAKIEKADPRYEISLFPYYFAQALKKRPEVFNNTDLIQLGMANVFCWVAYTLYDDFLDGEGVIEYLPVANVAMRKSLHILQSVFAHHNVQELITTLFDVMDQANSWELEKTRFSVTDKKITTHTIPDYGDLAILSNRAAGHIIAPLCMAQAAGFTQQQQQDLRQAFHHYIVARQLNDDLHDWVEDSKNGHCTHIMAQLLKRAHVSEGTYTHSKLKKTLKNYFWLQGFEELVHEATEHTRLAKVYYKKTNKFKINAPFFEFLNSIERSLSQATAEFNEKKQFLEQFIRSD